MEYIPEPYEYLRELVENSSWYTIMVLGIGYAVLGDKYILDKTIIPLVMKKLGEETEKFDKPNLQIIKLLLSGDSNVRDYGGSLATEFFKIYDYDDFNYFGLVQTLKKVAYSDESVFPRFKASTALIEVKKNTDKNNKSLELKLGVLCENLSAAAVENPDFKGIVKPYIEYCSKK